MNLFLVTVWYQYKTRPAIKSESLQLANTLEEAIKDVFIENGWPRANVRCKVYAKEINE